MKNFTIKTNQFNKDDITHNGNKFFTGNGYFGIRGTLEEYTKEHMCAVNLSGVYDKAGDGWRESVNAPNPLYTVLLVDNEKFALPERIPETHEQTLDITKGLHKRRTVWKTEKGNITIECERFSSMSHQHIIAMKYTFKIDFNADIEIITGIDGEVWDINGPHFKEIIAKTNKDFESVKGITGEKRIEVKTCQFVNPMFECDMAPYTDKYRAYRSLKFKSAANTEYTFTKVAVIETTADDITTKNIKCNTDYEILKLAHIEVWKKIWDISYIEIDGDEYAELSLNYSIYHLNCIAPRNQKNKSIAARGLSGQVYKGAIFWDTEMFMVDYFLYTEPKIVKTLIMYRINTLQGAMEKAISYGFDGAFYAWESQDGGLDACSDYNIVDVFTKRPMRTFFKDKQVHVSSAIVYAIDKYVSITGDTSVLTEGGATVILECAKFYRSIMLKYANKEFYEIHDVIGPDEYHERVNNNAYTNAMAKFVLETAVKYQEYIDGDISEFMHLAEQIKKPNIDKNGVIEQFDGYFELEDCSIEDVRSRLLDPKEYWGGAYGVASHTQIIKQADVVAMLCILHDKFDGESKHANLKYYEPRTEHGSSLSACMYSLLSCETGDAEFAYPLFMKSACADLIKGGKEWAGMIYIGGTHPASEGGSWIVAVEGFAGMKIENGKIVCAPCLPEKWNGMKFKINYKSAIYQVNITKDDWSVTKS